MVKLSNLMVQLRQVYPLVDGDNTIHFTALVKKDTSGNDVAEGAFSAVANFNLTYQ